MDDVYNNINNLQAKRKILIVLHDMMKMKIVTNSIPIESYNKLLSITQQILIIKIS